MNENNLEKLKAPFKNISWRIGSKNKDGSKARFLAYLDARDVMDRLDEVVGVENWKVEYEKIECKNSIIDWRNEKYTFIEKDYKTKKIIEKEDVKKVIHKINDETFIIMQAKLSIKFNDEWITKIDGSGTRDTETEKSLMSDALKRAGVLWGIGRYLYDVKTIYVPIDEYGNPTEEGKKILDKCLKEVEKGIYNNISKDEEKLNKSAEKETKTIKEDYKNTNSEKKIENDINKILVDRVDLFLNNSIEDIIEEEGKTYILIGGKKVQLFKKLDKSGIIFFTLKAVGKDFNTCAKTDISIQEQSTKEANIELLQRKAEETALTINK